MPSTVTVAFDTSTCPLSKTLVFSIVLVSGGGLGFCSMTGVGLVWMTSFWLVKGGALTGTVASAGTGLLFAATFCCGVGGLYSMTMGAGEMGARGTFRLTDVSCKLGGLYSMDMGGGGARATWLLALANTTWAEPTVGDAVFVAGGGVLEMIFTLRGDAAAGNSLGGVGCTFFS